MDRYERRALSRRRDANLLMLADGKGNRDQLGMARQ
jgi:hypothetical protein